MMQSPVMPASRFDISEMNTFFGSHESQSSIGQQLYPGYQWAPWTQQVSNLSAPGITGLQTSGNSSRATCSTQLSQIPCSPAYDGRRDMQATTQGTSFHCESQARLVVTDGQSKEASLTESVVDAMNLTN